MDFHLKEAESMDVAKYAVKEFEKGKFYILPRIDTKITKIGAKLLPTNLIAKIAYMIQERKIGKRQSLTK